MSIIGEKRRKILGGAGLLALFAITVAYMILIGIIREIFPVPLFWGLELLGLVALIMLTKMALEKPNKHG